MPEAALHFSTPDDREELARAELYGLLANLYVARPPLYRSAYVPRRRVSVGKR